MVVCGIFEWTNISPLIFVNLQGLLILNAPPTSLHLSALTAATAVNDEPGRWHSRNNCKRRVGVPFTAATAVNDETRVFGTWYQVLGINALGTSYLVPGAWCPVHCSQAPAIKLESN